MIYATGWQVLDLLLRGATCGLMLLLVVVMLRDHGKQTGARLAAAFAFGTAAFAICSAVGMHERLGWWSVPILAVAAGNNVILWALACSLFDDRFELRWWHAAAWIAVVTIGLLNGYTRAGTLFELSGLVLTLSALGFAVLAIAQTIASWQADLVEQRRRLRIFIVVAAGIYTILSAASQLLGAYQAAPAIASLISATGLAAIASAVAAALLKVGSGAELFATAAAASRAMMPSAQMHNGLNAVDQKIVVALIQLMDVDRIYRDEGLTIGGLAQRVGIPEHRLRRIINAGLGHRNFNSFLNGYRLSDAKSALSDGAQSGVPILTIAMDAGFGSLGPFNRAFKVETGMTPSEFRQRAGVAAPITPPGISGSALPISAVRS